MKRKKQGRLNKVIKEFIACNLSLFKKVDVDTDVYSISGNNLHKLVYNSVTRNNYELPKVILDESKKKKERSYL